MKIIINFAIIICSVSSVYSKQYVLGTDFGENTIDILVTEPSGEVSTIWVCSDLQSGVWTRLWNGDGIITEVISTGNPVDAQEKIYTVSNLWDSAVFVMAPFLEDEPLVLTNDLTVGSRGEEVAMLQAWLSNAGFLDLGDGPYGYFGSSTQSALANFQDSVGIVPSVGYFGPITRSYIASMTPHVAYQLVSTETSSPYEEGDLGLFRFEFEISNFTDEDIYIPKRVSESTIEIVGPSNNQSPAIYLDSYNAEDIGEYYRVRVNQTVDFQLIVAVTVDNTGFYSTTLRGISWSCTASTENQSLTIANSTTDSIFIVGTNL
jgi:peptidoglycan hydrolase-like protein with peptidoglycan-binding domain